jgi:hypothetical protein
METDLALHTLCFQETEDDGQISRIVKRHRQEPFGLDYLDQFQASEGKSLR